MLVAADDGEAGRCDAYRWQPHQGERSVANNPLQCLTEHMIPSDTTAGQARWYATANNR